MKQRPNRALRRAVFHGAEAHVPAAGLCPITSFSRPTRSDLDRRNRACTWQGFPTRRTSIQLPMSSSRIPTLLFLLLISSCASLGSFQDLDVDNDGGINREEAGVSGRLMEMFETADDNNDGVLDQDEFADVKTILERYRREDASQRRSGGRAESDQH